MIIVKLMGGLGNQMFQYAFGKHLATKNKTELKLDTTFLLDRTPPKNEHFVFRNYDLSIFNINEQFATIEEINKYTKRTSNVFLDKTLNKLLGTKKSYVKDLKLHFLPKHLTISKNVYIEGYWQSEKYFKSISDELRQKDFVFKEPLMEISESLMQQIRSVNAVCVNVRRGDFVTNSFHGTMGSDYYKKAENLLIKKYTDLEIFVFSDEIDWCEENLNFSVPTHFISHKYAGNKFQDYLRLMSACKHFIIPNSSFAWWAVWFSLNPNKMVIAPKQWVNDSKYSVSDLIPNSWIQL